MKIQDLVESKKMPGAISGIKIMSPEEFVQGDEEVDEQVGEYQDDQQST
mgnify:CR=1 FL=1